jgi:hypothetical protein
MSETQDDFVARHPGLIPLDDASRERLRGLVKDRWPGSAIVQGVKDGEAHVGPSGGLYTMGVPASVIASGQEQRAIENLARSLESGGWAIWRHEGIPYVLGFDPAALLAPWEAAHDARTKRLANEWADRDALAGRGSGSNAKLDHYVAVERQRARSLRRGAR